MEIAFLIVVIFLFLLAVFDLSVGVGNDAVNFLNSLLALRRHRSSEFFWWLQQVYS